MNLTKLEFQESHGQDEKYSKRHAFWIDALDDLTKCKNWIKN